MRRSTFGILFYIKKNEPKKNGLATIMTRLTIDGRQIQFSSKLEIDPEHWNQKSNKVKETAQNAEEMNNMIHQIRCRLLSHYVELSQRNIAPTPVRVKNAFLGLKDTSSLLYLFNEHIRHCKARIGKNLSKVSYERYQITATRLSKFLKTEYNLVDIPVEKIDIRFIEEFYIFLRNHYGCCNNTALKYLQRLATIMRYAERMGLVIRNPFIYYKFRLDRVDTAFLSQSEVEIILQKKFQTKRLEEVKDIFVFSCYTGLSFSDIVALKRNDIYSSFDNKPWIMVNRKKTNIASCIPILPIAQQIIDKYDSGNHDDRLFPVRSNQKTNEYLKEITNICNINKPVTFHTARHTFAVLMLDNGVSLESLSRMMGHSNIKSTMIYARITDRKVNKEMDLVARKLTQ